RPIELIGPGQHLEPRLVRRHELLEELAIEAVQVVDGVDDREARADAERERDLAEPRLQIDDDRRPFAEARELDGAVDGDRRRAGAAFRAEEDERGRRGPRAL